MFCLRAPNLQPLEMKQRKVKNVVHPNRQLPRGLTAGSLARCHHGSARRGRWIADASEVASIAHLDPRSVQPAYITAPAAVGRAAQVCTPRCSGEDRNMRAENKPAHARVRRGLHATCMSKLAQLWSAVGSRRLPRLHSKSALGSTEQKGDAAACRAHVRGRSDQSFKQYLLGLRRRADERWPQRRWASEAPTSYRCR